MESELPPPALMGQVDYGLQPPAGKCSLYRVTPAWLMVSRSAPMENESPQPARIRRQLYGTLIPASNWLSSFHNWMKFLSLLSARMGSAWPQPAARAYPRFGTQPQDRYCSY